MSETKTNEKGLVINLDKGQLRVIFIAVLVICLFIPGNFQMEYNPMIAIAFKSTLAFINTLLEGASLLDFMPVDMLLIFSVFFFYWSPLVLIIVLLRLRVKPSTALKNIYIVFLLLFYAITWYGVQSLIPLGPEQRLILLVKIPAFFSSKRIDSKNFLGT